MKKILKKFDVPYYLNWKYATIDQIREDLNEIEKLGATYVELGYTENDGCVSVYVDPKVNRLETDEEFEKRISDENDSNERIKTRELAELERLKNKYNQ